MHENRWTESNQPDSQIAPNNRKRVTITSATQRLDIEKTRLNERTESNQPISKLLLTIVNASHSLFNIKRFRYKQTKKNRDNELTQSNQQDIQIGSNNRRRENLSTPSFLRTPHSTLYPFGRRKGKQRSLTSGCHGQLSVQVQKTSRPQFWRREKVHIGDTQSVPNIRHASRPHRHAYIFLQGAAYKCNVNKCNGERFTLTC